MHVLLGVLRTSARLSRSLRYSKRNHKNNVGIFMKSMLLPSCEKQRFAAKRFDDRWKKLSASPRQGSTPRHAKKSKLNEHP